MVFPPVADSRSSISFPLISSAPSAGACPLWRCACACEGKVHLNPFLYHMSTHTHIHTHKYKAKPRFFFLPTHIAHIHPQFCNLSASQKRRGGLIRGIWHSMLRIRTSSDATPRCWHRNIILQIQTNRSWFDTDLPSLLSSSRNSMVKINLTEVDCSIDSGIYTTHEHAYACNWRWIP